MRDPIVLLQNLLPQPWLAQAFGRLARSERPWLRELLIRGWIRAFGVSLAEAVRGSSGEYRSFEDFFTRELQLGARPMPEGPLVLAAPADGFLHEFGALRGDMLVQAKGIEYPLDAMLGDIGVAEAFRDGWYATIYLSPADYHRVHAPIDAVLRCSLEIPGQAYSVTPRTEASLPNLYCRNERLVCLFETSSGPLALVMVGAFIVTGIETVWRPRKPISSFERIQHDLSFRRGDELGRFTLGSTVVLVLPARALEPRPDLREGDRLRVGRPLGTCVHP